MDPDAVVRAMNPQVREMAVLDLCLRLQHEMVRAPYSHECRSIYLVVYFVDSFSCFWGCGLVVGFSSLSPPANLFF